MSRKIFCGLLLLLIAGSANAAFYSTPKFKPTVIGVSNPGNYPLRIYYPAFTSTAPCVVSGYGFLYLEDSDADFNNKYVAIMMAYKAGKFLQFTFDDSKATACHIVEFSIWDNYP